MTVSVELKMRGQMDHLRLAWQAGETLLAGVPFEEDPEGTRYNILLAIQELITNVLRHGLPEGRDDETIELQLEASPNHFTFELRDQGAPFDPTGYRGEPVDGKEFPPEAGGYGLEIVRMVMDGFEYEHKDGWNVVRGTKSVVCPVAVASNVEPF